MEELKIKISPETIESMKKIIASPVMRSIFAECEIDDYFFYLRDKPIDNFKNFKYNQN